jgi:hypothetical protein
MKAWILAFMALILVGFALALQGQAQAEQDIIDWATRPQWNETSLRGEGTEKTIFRTILLTPFWGQAVAHLTMNRDGSGELVTKWWDDRDRPSNNLVSKTRHLPPKEVSSFLESVKKAGFWELPTNAVTASPPHKLYVDADTCILEAIDTGTYHAVRRPVLRPETPFTNACSFFTRPALVEAVRSTHSH